MTATRREAMTTFAAIAAVGTAAVAEPTVVVSSDRSRWDALLAQRAELHHAIKVQSEHVLHTTAESPHWARGNEQLDALCHSSCKLDDTIMDTPAPDRDALLWKIETFFGPDDTVWTGGFADQFYADARRLLAGRAA
jgi:hypothetical protein